MSWTDGKPAIATETQTKLHWGNKGFQCSLCGHKFAAGDTFRFVFANFKGSPVHCGNFFTCAKCDGDDVLDRAGASYVAARDGAKRWGIYGPDWQNNR